MYQQKLWLLKKLKSLLKERDLQTARNCWPREGIFLIPDKEQAKLTDYNLVIEKHNQGLEPADVDYEWNGFSIGSLSRFLNQMVSLNDD